MPFLNNAEREHFEQVPKGMANEVIQQYFFLNQEDKAFINSFKGNLTKTAIAIQIGIVRLIGYLPEKWPAQISSQIIEYVSDLLRIDIILTEDMLEYGSRQATRSIHFQQVLKHLNFRRWQPLIDEPHIEKWLVERGMEHDNERFLLERLNEKLYNDKILRPSITALERIIGGVDERLNEETYKRLNFLWNDLFFGELDGLLEIDADLKLTHHRWLCMAPTSNTSKSINLILSKIQYLKKLNVEQWDLSAIPVNRKKRLANIARNNTNAYLMRMKPKKRYAILVCFLYETLLDTTDNALIMYNDFWTQAINDAKKAHDMYQIGISKTQSKAVVTLAELGKIVLNEDVDSQQLRPKIFETYSKEEINSSIDLVLKINQPAKRNHLFFLVGFYHRFRSFSINFFKTLDFEIAFNKDNFGEALDMVMQVQMGNRKKYPNNVAINFITQTWGKQVFNESGLQPMAFELCVLSVLRDRLQSGDVFVKFSRKFADFNSFLIPKERWELEKETICSSFGGIDITGRIDEMVLELTQMLGPLSDLLSNQDNPGDIRIENGQLVLPGNKAEEPSESVLFLREQINLRLPKVGLAEIIREVDSWENFSREIKDDSNSKNPEHESLKFAALMGNACNLSYADLSRSSDLDYQSLRWVANNYFTEENLKRANNLLVNFHHRQWLPSYWGDGTLSSSDGQRFPTSGKIRSATASPKYFGTGKGLTIYTHSSDQYSQYGTKAISSTVRDATFVLDEILSNETDLDIQEHTTDTHGYTDLLFGFFEAVNKRLISRLADMKNQKLCKIKSKENPEYDLLEYPPLKFTGTVNIDFLKNNADEIRRVAASLLTGTVSASLLISKLQAYPRQNNLMQVLQAFGQLGKTNFICRYLLSPELRLRVGKQLNKGEQLHNLRLYLWFGGDGIIRKQQEKEQQITAKGLNVMCSIVMVWNTVYIQEILKALQAEGFDIQEEDFEHISPAPFEHYNRLGKYNFKGDIQLEGNGLRALSKPNKII